VAIRDTVSRAFAPQNTKIWHKLALVAATLVLPVTALNWLLLSSQRSQISLARQELEGLDYLKPLRSLTEHVIEHRGLANSFLLGDAASRREMLSRQSEIDADLKAIDEAGAGLTDSLGAGQAFATVRQQWGELRRQSGAATAQRSFDLHNQLLKEIHAAWTAVSRTSNLAFDPVPSSALLTDTLTRAIPAQADILGQIRDLAVANAQGKAWAGAQKPQLLEAIGQNRPFRQSIDANLTATFRAVPDLETPLKNMVADHLTATDELVALVQKGVVSPEVPTASAPDIAEAGNRAISSAYGLYDRSAPYLGSLIQGRKSAERSSVIVGVLWSIAGVLLTLLVGARITRGITDQAQSITDLCDQIGVGNYEARADVTSNDELGTMAASLNTMLDNTLVLVQSREDRDAIQGAIMKLLDEVSGVADGDLTREARVTEDVTGAIADAFNHMINELRRIISDVQDATLQVGESASEIHANSVQLVRGSETQAQQILATSTAIEEVALSIQQVSDNAADSAAVAQQALANATQGNEAVQNTIQGMNRIRDQAQETAKRIKRLGESSQEIGQIIQLIDDIADRTSILALNASIQAAAAGEAGRGFAVVAEEVERLAERSTDATKKIATLVKTIQTETNEAVGSMEKSIHEVVEGSKLANQAGKALEEIGSVSTRLAELIQSISEASKQQARGSEAIAKSMGNMSQITQQTAAGTRLAADSVSDLAALSLALRNSVSTFRLPGREWEPEPELVAPRVNGNGHADARSSAREVVDRITSRSGEFRRKPVHV
jgi:twitching motility protein PilJ